MSDKHITQMTIEEFYHYVEDGLGAYSAMANNPESSLYDVLRQVMAYVGMVSFYSELDKHGWIIVSFTLGMLCEREGWYIPDESLQPPTEQKSG